MNEPGRKRAGRLILELAGIQADIEVLRDENADAGSLLSGLEAEALVRAWNAIEAAIKALKEAGM